MKPDVDDILPDCLITDIERLAAAGHRRYQVALARHIHATDQISAFVRDAIPSPSTGLRIGAAE